ncbi:MAG: outer membrane homotrimeric porin [Solidesulfovibrio sp.]|uniref:outer membrane homotrimeric porin n=1 Tax=Solidesulfovibrio sp. TaxID=2910990 RepID=UPI00315866AC
MRRIALSLLLAALVMGTATSAQAATEVRMVGESMIFGNYFANQNFTGWNRPSWTSPTPTWTGAGTQTEDRFQIWERFRVRTDFIANEAVKFRLGLHIQDIWGHGTFTAANPTTAIQVYQAFLQFKLPNCDAEVTAGLQDMSLPSSDLFYQSVVWGGDRAAALVVKATLIPDTLGVTAGFSRLIDTNRTFDGSTTQVGDELDLYFLTLPITTTAFKTTPWAAATVAGRDVNYYTNASYGNSAFAENLLSAGTLLAPTKWKNNQNAYFWVGDAFEITALDPVRFYGDVIYGAGAMADSKKSKRAGWFIDFGAEYTGFDILTPKAFGWWSTGEDKSNRNGSERLPTLDGCWGPGNSFLFDNNQDLYMNSNMGMSAVGSWGLGASLDNVSFMEKLSHRLTFIYLQGNNSARAIRSLNALLGSNPYFQMGHDLTTNEHVLGVNFDNKYMLYENLALLLETGWAHGEFQKSVWGKRLVDASRDGDTWKVAFGFQYKF